MADKGARCNDLNQQPSSHRRVSRFKHRTNDSSRLWFPGTCVTLLMFSIVRKLSRFQIDRDSFDEFDKFAVNRCNQQPRPLTVQIFVCLQRKVRFKERYHLIDLKKVIILYYLYNDIFFVSFLNCCINNIWKINLITIDNVHGFLI